MGEMVGLAETVEGIECATPLEAEVRELRLIAEHKPKYNRRSRFPERVHWIKLTREPWPRLSLVRNTSSTTAPTTSGPYSSQADRRAVLAALHEAFPIRQCSGRMPKVPSMSPCALAEMGKCLSPCDGSVDAGGLRRGGRPLRDNLLAVRTTWSSRSRGGWPLLPPRALRGRRLHRDRLAPSCAAPPAPSGLAALTRCPEVVGARREDGRWAVHVVRHGRLAAAGVIPPAPTPATGCAPAGLGRDGRRPAQVRYAGRHRRGDRADPALAGVRRCAPGARRGRVDLPGRRRHPAPRVHDAVEQSRASPGPVRRPTFLPH
jgi:DNA polymerase-3 subunit epsilon